MSRVLELDPYYEPALANKAVVTGLADGEKLGAGAVKSVNYW